MQIMGMTQKFLHDMTNADSVLGRFAVIIFIDKTEAFHVISREHQPAGCEEQVSQSVINNGLNAPPSSEFGNVFRFMVLSPQKGYRITCHVGQQRTFLKISVFRRRESLTEVGIDVAMKHTVFSSGGRRGIGVIPQAPPPVRADPITALQLLRFNIYRAFITIQEMKYTRFPIAWSGATAIKYTNRHISVVFLQVVFPLCRHTNSLSKFFAISYLLCCERAL